MLRVYVNIHAYDFVFEELSMLMILSKALSISSLLDECFLADLSLL
jgi:hypothetical protein